VAAWVGLLICHSQHCLVSVYGGANLARGREELMLVMDGAKIACGISRGADVAKILRDGGAKFPVTCPLCSQPMQTCERCGCLVHVRDVRGEACSLCDVGISF
jgi:hypothetical protein